MYFGKGWKTGVFLFPEERSNQQQVTTSVRGCVNTWDFFFTSAQQQNLKSIKTTATSSCSSFLFLVCSGKRRAEMFRVCSVGGSLVCKVSKQVQRQLQCLRLRFLCTAPRSHSREHKPGQANRVSTFLICTSIHPLCLFCCLCYNISCLDDQTTGP